MRLLNDGDVRRLGARDAVEAMREMLVAHAVGEYFSPPRISSIVGSTRLLVGAGATSEGAMGVRVSGPASSPLEHVTLTWLSSGELETVIVGNELGARRTGAVAAVAADVLAVPGPVRVGIVGSGRNAWAQIWALTGARTLSELIVYSPTPAHSDRFAARARDELGVDARAVPEARMAVEAMDVVVLCTTSRTPVIEAAWVGDDTHVTSIGAKSRDAHEVPEGLLDRMSRVVSDAPGEIVSPVSDLRALPLVELGAVLAGGTGGRQRGEVSLFLYAGLGGSDAFYAQRVAALAH